MHKFTQFLSLMIDHILVLCEWLVIITSNKLRHMLKTVQGVFKNEVGKVLQVIMIFALVLGIIIGIALGVHFDL
ncbi:hypothetical protein GCM10026987_28170 [Belliella aquatica]|uniref:Uncharacterized protein n=1 Tax=Belliella aquatica TaxID=1323734 RepID=A0ABQ1N5W8_9BACT|nr:hypothetical protein GCM10010993_36840 [Belliella aquatica]